MRRKLAIAAAGVVVFMVGSVLAAMEGATETPGYVLGFAGVALVVGGLIFG